MTSITKEQLESILEKKLEQKLAPIKKSFEELHKLVVFTSGQYDALLSNVTSCEKENSTLKDENKILKSALGSLETSLKSLLKANNEQEQYSRRECVEIRGVPERAGESTNHLVKEVGRALGVEVTDNDISVSHRLPPSKAHKTKKPVGPPPIIAKFVRRDMKEAFYRARMKLKGKTTNDLGLSEANNIYISESLTASNRQLFNEALKVKKDLHYKFIWSSNGRVFMRATEDSPPILISCSDDLVKKVKSQHGSHG